MNLQERRPLVYTIFSRHMFYAREIISAFALYQGVIPVNPFMNFNYFLGDQAERDLIRNGNNNIIMRADEVWCFGPLANGCVAEVDLAMKLGKPVRFFSAGPKIENISALQITKLEFEAENEIDIPHFIQRIQSHVSAGPEVVN